MSGWQPGPYGPRSVVRTNPHGEVVERRFLNDPDEAADFLLTQGNPVGHRSIGDVLAKRKRKRQAARQAADRREYPYGR